MTNVILDDLELRSTITHSISVPVRNRGSHVSASGFTIDLDTGTVSPTPVAATDLIWNQSIGFATSGPSGLTVTGASYGVANTVKISRMPLAGNQIAASLVPYSVSPIEAFPAGQCRGFRRADIGWAACPSPCLACARAGWRAPARMDNMGHAHAFSRNRSALDSTRTRRGDGVDHAKLLVLPVVASKPLWRVRGLAAACRLPQWSYQWCLCGEVLEGEHGNVDTRYGPLSWRVDGRQLFVDFDLGQAVDCEVSVSAIDSRGIELFTCIRVNLSGIEKNCRKCDPNQPIIVAEFLEVEPALATWRPLIRYGGRGRACQEAGVVPVR